MSIWIVLPTKPFTKGKSRLSHQLTKQQRYELNHFLFSQTLATAIKLLPHHTLVISSCQSILNFAAQLGAKILIEQAPYEINNALDQATQWLKHQDVTHLLIIPTDLPNLILADLEMMISYEKDNFVIAPDRANDGTNAMFLPLAGQFRYQYGQQSYLRHVEEARHLEMPIKVIQNTSLAFDLDTFDDYTEWTNGSLP